MTSAVDRVEEVTRFRASDGMMFETMDAACAYEDIRVIKVILGKSIADSSLVSLLAKDIAARFILTEREAKHD